MKKNFSDYLNEASDNSADTIQEMMSVELKMLEQSTNIFNSWVQQMHKNWSKETGDQKVLKKQAKEDVDILKERINRFNQYVKTIENRLKTFK